MIELMYHACDQYQINTAVVHVYNGRGNCEVLGRIC